MLPADAYDVDIWVAGIALFGGLGLMLWLLLADEIAWMGRCRDIEVGLAALSGMPLICTRPELGHDGPCNGLPAETCWQHVSVPPPENVTVLTRCATSEGDAYSDYPMVFGHDGGWRYLTPDAVHLVARPYFEPTHWRLRSSRA